MITQQCRRHRRRPAQAVCVSCLAPVCAACLVTTRVGVKCRPCGGAPARSRGRAVAVLLAAGAAVCAAVVLVVLLAGRAPGPEAGGGVAQPRRGAVPTPSAASFAANPAVGCMQDHQMC